jgi:hypothetical protein
LDVLEAICVLVGIAVSEVFVVAVAVCVELGVDGA